MDLDDKKIGAGVYELMANAHRESSFTGKRFSFDGDLRQMATAMLVAHFLNVQTEIDGGIPFVKSESDYRRVTEYLIENKINGYWNYQ